MGSAMRYTQPWNAENGYLYEKLDNLDINIAALAGGSVTTPTAKPVAAGTVYDTAGSQTLVQVTLSDGAVKYYTDASLTNEVAAAGVVLGFPPSSGSVSFDAGAVDATTTRVELTTESQAATSKTGTSEWVKDAANDNIVWQEAVYDAITDTFSYTYTVSPGGAAYTPVGALTPSSVSVGEIVTVAKVDDVAGDQTGALVNYVEVRVIDPDTGLTNTLSTLTEDLSGPYTVQGTPRNASEIGVNAKTAPFQITLPVGPWVPSVLVESFAYYVWTVADTNNPPTFTDTDGNVDSLFAGESADFSLSDNTEALKTNLQITVNTGDVIKVYGTKFSA